MLRRPPRSTRTDTLFPYTTLFRSVPASAQERLGRLFFTPAQRASLDVARSQRARAAVATEKSEQEATPVPPTITYSRSEEHQTELQSLMHISYAAFCVKKNKLNNKTTRHRATPSTMIIATIL